MAMRLCEGMETITLTMEEQKRVGDIERVSTRELRMAEAAMVLGVSERHSYRIKAKIRKEGVKGVVHGNRGRHSDRELGMEIERRIVKPLLRHHTGSYPSRAES